MEKYLRGQMLGKGSYGAAYVATAKADGRKFVVKEISLQGLSQKEVNTATQEAEVFGTAHGCTIAAAAGDRCTCCSCCWRCSTQTSSPAEKPFSRTTSCISSLSSALGVSEGVLHHGTAQQTRRSSLSAVAGDLSGIIGKQQGQLLPENVILDWFSQLCLGLAHIHSRKIVHRYAMVFQLCLAVTAAD